MKSTDRFMNQIILRISFTHTRYHHICRGHMVKRRVTRSSRTGKLILHTAPASVFIKVTNLGSKKYQNKSFLRESYHAPFLTKTDCRAHMLYFPMALQSCQSTFLRQPFPVYSQTNIDHLVSVIIDLLVLKGQSQNIYFFFSL